MVDKKEIHEARTVAREALRLLAEVEQHLKSARNWGIFDMLKGGFVTSMIKHGKLDRADSLLRQVRNKLQQLQKELSDVNLGLDPTLDISSFHRFMDIVFDNIVSDWIVQSKINDSLRDVQHVSSEVHRVISVLDQIERQYGR